MTLTLKSKGDAVSTRWTQGLKPEQKEKFLQALRHDTLVLGRLQEILAEELRELSSKESKVDSYDCPSWAYRQAHLNGVRQTYQHIASLLSFLK
jgi:hypothetical protein